VGRMVDLDDLIDARGVADLVGLGGRNAVYTYRRRYGDFPAPGLMHGRCMLWLRDDVARWKRDRSSRKRS
jgi:predicted DNA-binding transcriptional regulator AlpA